MERSAGIWSENAAKYSVMVIDCVPGLVIERSVAQSPPAERIEPAPGIMRAWKDDGSRFSRIVPIFVPEVCVPPPVTVRVTIFVPALPQACEAVRPVAVPPSPKSHAKVALGSGSVAVKVIRTPAAPCQPPVSGSNSAPVSVDRFDGGGGPPVPMVMTRVAVFEIDP